MSRRLFHVSLCVLWTLFLQTAATDAQQEAAQQAPYAATPGEPACPGKGGLVKARVVAIDQALWLNRLGASLPNGMIFALERDVCAPDSKGTGCGTGRPSKGNAMLRPDKRPRPLVLRVNQDQCLEITFTNWLSDSAVDVTTPIPNAQDQPSTRAASIHLQGMEWVASSADDGSWVGRNASSLTRTGETHVYTLYAAHEGTFLLYSAADSYTNPGGGANADGGQVAFGLFGAVHVEPKGAEWYRSQVTAEDLKLASTGTTPGKQPVLNYRAVYPAGHPRAGVPILNMLQCPKQASQGCPNGGEIVHGDLTALITGREKDGKPGRFPVKDLRAPVFNPAYSLPDRLEPYREFTIIYHEIMQAVQAFDQLYNGASLNFDGNGADNYAFNYGSGGIASEIVANRLGVGPMGNCTGCKYEEFFLTSWAVGDPAMVVDTPATDACTPQGTCGTGSCDPDTTSTCSDNSTCQFTGYTCDSSTRATKAYYPDDPSNVYHSYMSDHTKFRILHAGPDLHHLHHQHAHQWLHTPDSPAGDYTDSQSLGPGSGFTLEMVYNGSGNVNQTVGDSIFHCHFYPHFAGGMWALWRVHDVFEDGSRSLPDGEIAQGTPIPGVVPLPTKSMPPMPGTVRLAAGGKQAEVCDDQGGNCVSVFSNTKLDPARYKNPGFPFFIPGLAGQRAPHPPLDFAKENPDDPRSANLDGGLPRHLIKECPSGTTCTEAPTLNALDFSKTLENVAAFELPENGTGVEQLAMAAHARRFHLSFTPENRKEDFILNGLPPVAGAPFADPCIVFHRAGGRPQGLTVRRYKAAAFQTDAVFNREGWHFPQQRMLALWGDVVDSLAGLKPPEPLFFRANSGECIEYTHANLVPNVYELDDFQVRTPTDILGQHIHLVKFDVTASDGATNGFNYEDGTLSPDEVSERIRAINAAGGLAASADPKSAQRKLTAKAIPFFGAGPGGRWLGAQATIQRWYSDPLFDGCCHDPVQPGAKDRTLRTVFTHDHFGPSTHQQAGLYAGLVIEPPKSLWYENEKVSGEPFGGTNPTTGQPLPGRTVTGPGGTRVADGGPTTWQAVIETPDLPRQSTRRDSFREFLIEMQDTTLTYAPFPSSAVSGFATQGFCADTGTSCTPATATKASQGCSPVGVCIGLGFCSNNPTLSCKPATWLADADTSGCGNDATCNLIPGVPGQLASYAPFAPGNSSATVDTNIYAWGTLPIDPPNKIAAEVITLAGGTNSFSVNYRSEPLYPRINSQRAADLAASTNTAEQALATQLNDLSHAYRSLDRGPLGGLCTGTSQFCTTSAQCATGTTCDLIKKPPYPPLTRDVGPGDPFTPLLRAYAGDDVQIRTLTGAHINPHNFTLYGLKWLAEGSFVDSGWRASQTMGISEHFEQLFRIPSWVSDKGSSDYLYMGGAAAIEQAGGNWGLLRAYGARRDDLRPLPQNQTPGRAQKVPVCPADATARKYTVAALTAQQALGGSLTFNSRAGGSSQADAILYFKREDLSCPSGKLDTTCTARNQKNPEPLVLRANAGDCLQVTLHNLIDKTKLSSTTGASSPNLLPVAQTDPPTFGGVACGGTGAADCLTSTISTEVGLHPQLVSYDVTQGDAFNAGNNPIQTVAIGKSRTYTWYAGNIDTSVEPPRHIPIEFGTANLLPSDVINHYQLGLFGALVIEPRGATGWKPEDGVTAVVRDERGRVAFREHVLAMEDGLAKSSLALGNDAVNAFNYKSEPLANRSCAKSGDYACVLSSKAALCCKQFNSSGTCVQTGPCGEPQTPILRACAGEQVRFRMVHPGGINTDNTFELFGHVWAETPYMSRGPLACSSPTTHTNLYASAVISNERGCTLAQLGAKGPLPLYGPQPDTLSEWQGFHLGHGPSNHFDVLIEKAGGSNAVPGDYLYRSYPAMHFRLGAWGIFRVEDAKSNAPLCGGR